MHFKLLHNKRKWKRNKIIHCCRSPSSPVVSLHHPSLKLPRPRGFYNSLSQSPMFPISSSSCCFIHKNGLWFTLANGFLFHRCQFSSNLFQYSCLYFFSPHPYNNFVVYFPGNSLLNTFSSFSLSCYRVSFSSLLYSFSNSSTKSLAFLRFSLLSQVSSSAMHPFHCTRYLSLPRTRLLFIIFSTSHSSSPSIITSCHPFFPSNHHHG